MESKNSHAVSGIRLIFNCLFVVLLISGFGTARADVTFTGDVTPDPSSGNVTPSALNVGGENPGSVTIDMNSGPTTLVSGLASPPPPPSPGINLGATVGSVLGGDGWVTVDGGTWQNNGGTGVGEGGNGTVIVKNGGTIVSYGDWIGTATGAVGTVIVESGSTWTNNNWLTIATQPGSFGSVLVTGANSMAGAAGNATNVGLGGTGSLTINDGGAFEALFISVGRTNGAIGTMNVDGSASSVLISGSSGAGGSGAFLTVGREGGSQGTAHFTNGAQVNIQNFADTNNAGFNVGRSIGSNGTINVSGGAAINVTGNGTAANVGRGGTGVLNIFDGGKVGLTSSATNATVRIGRDGGNGTVTINGTGSQLTVQSNTGSAIVHVGDGTISPGMLDVKNGGMVSAHEVVVNTNGTLMGGGGMISALVTVNGGTVAPGNSPGTMTIDGDLAFNSGSLDIEIGELSSDFLHVTGAASFLAGTFDFSFLDGFLPASDSSWLFLTADGGLSGWEGLDLAVSGLNSSYSWFISQDGNDLSFNVAAVPEPEIYAMLGVGLGLMGWVGRRRTLQAA